MTVIYCDYAASTPLDPKVQRAMETHRPLGNASSGHRYGLQARQQIAQAKKAIGALINASSPSDIVLTSGATESINMVLKGVALQAMIEGNASPHMVTSAVEHKATLDPCKQLQALGCKVTKIPVDGAGRVDCSALETVLKEKPLLFSLMHVNNEVGAIQPIEAVAELLRESECLFHVDAAQSVGKLPVDVQALSVDYLSFSSHKLYGPQGIGALYVKPGAQRYVQPLISGGGHQQGLRSGTLPVNLAIGFGVACECGQRQWEKDLKTLQACRKHLLSILQRAGGVRVLGDPASTYPGILSVCIEGVHGDMLAGLLQNRVAFSVGSACTSHFHEPSHVLQAMGIDQNCLSSIIRLSFGRFSTLDEMETVGAALCEGIAALRACSPKEVGHLSDTVSHKGHKRFVSLQRGNHQLTFRCHITAEHVIKACTIHIFSAYGGWQLKVFLEEYLQNKPIDLLKNITADELIEKMDEPHRDFEIALLFEDSLKQLCQQEEKHHE